MIETSIVNIREAQASEIRDLIWISQETFYNSFASVNKASDMQEYMNDALNPTQIQNEFQSSTCKFYLAYRKNTLAGYMKINWPESQSKSFEVPALELQRIYVLKSFQGQGIGQILFDRFMDIAHAELFQMVWLGVWEHNQDAIRFYERNGMSPFGKHEFFLGKDLQYDILFKKSI